jgi:flagellar protein FliO/FliZ
MRTLYYGFLSTLLLSFSAFAEETQPVSINHSQNVWQLIIGLLSIIALIFIVVWLMKKVGYGQYQATSGLKIKGCLPLSNKEKIFLIEAGNEQILIGVAPGSIAHLKTLDEPITQSQNTAATSAFAEKLKSIINKGEAVE